MFLVLMPESSFYTDTLLTEAALERKFWFFNQPDKIVIEDDVARLDFGKQTYLGDPSPAGW